MRVDMKNRNLLESIVDEQIERKRLNEINQLIKEYDSLDSILIENKSYDRDVQIVVRLDELGVFDDILEVVPRERKESRKRNMFVNRELQKLRAAGLPDSMIEKERKNLEKSWNAERTIDSRLAKSAADIERRQQTQTEPEQPVTSKSTFGVKIGQLAKMLGSAVKSGKTQLVSKIKAAINKVRGKKPDTPVSDIPGISKDVASKVDATPAQVSASPEGEADLFGGTSTPEPTKKDTTEPETPTSAPSDPDQTNLDFDTPAEEPAVEEPKDSVSPETKDRLQALAGIKPEEPDSKKPITDPENNTSKKPITDPVETPDAPEETPPVAKTGTKGSGTKKITGRQSRGTDKEPGSSDTSGAADTSDTGTKGGEDNTSAPQGTSTEPQGTTVEPPSPPSVAQQTMDKTMTRLGLPAAPNTAKDTTTGTTDKPDSAPPPPPPPPAPPQSPSTSASGVSTEKPATTEPPKPEKPETPASAPEPKKPVQPWSRQGREARAKELADMSPEEKARAKEKSMRRMGFVPDKRSFTDRVKSAGRAFMAPAGTSVETEPMSWKSRFAEVLQMMEELQQIERQLHELSLAEGLVGGQKKLDVAPPYGKLTSQDFAQLRARRSHLRKALVKEMIREELEKHNTTLAELNPRQRTALMEYVKKRSTKMWEMMAEARMNETAGDN